MARFISKEKMSKKKQKELNAAARGLWAMNPRTRVKESAKTYKRSREKIAARISERESGGVSFT